MDLKKEKAAPRARAGFSKISKLHASTRAMRARAEKSACCDCTRVAEHWYIVIYDAKVYYKIVNNTEAPICVKSNS